MFLELRAIDISIGGVIEDTGLTRATTYNICNELLATGFLKPTRKVAGTQLYKLDDTKKEVRTLLKVFDMILDQIAEEYREEPIKKKATKKEVLVQH